MAAKLSLTLTESAVNITNNTSKVTAKLYYYGNGVSYNNNSPSGSITIDGTKYTFSKSFTTSTSAQLLATKEKTVTHNTNGSKTVTVSASFKTGVSLGTLSTSKNITLTNIARATVPTLNKVSIPLNNSDTVTINTPRASSSFTHTLTYAIGSASGTIASGVGTSYSWKPPVSLLNNITTSTSGTITITCKTYNGSDLIGTKTVNISATVPDNIKPSISSVNITEQNTTVTNAFGNRYIKGLSEPKITISAAGAYGSTIVNYKIRNLTNNKDICNTNNNYYTLNPYNGSHYIVGTNIYEIIVTDSRGRQNSTTREINFIPYLKPTLSLRYEILTSTSIRVTIDGRISSVENQNTKSLILKYKKNSETDWQSKTVTLSDWDFYTSTDITELDNDKYSYNIQAILTDKINSVSREITSGKILMSKKAGGTGLTLFGEATEDGFVVDGGGRAHTTLNNTTFNCLKKDLDGEQYFDEVYLRCNAITGNYGSDFVAIYAGPTGYLPTVTFGNRKADVYVLGSDVDIGSADSNITIEGNTTFKKDITFKNKNLSDLLNNMFGTYHDLNATAVNSNPWTVNDVSAFLMGTNVRAYIKATRSSATGAGNIANEKICTVTLNHGGKIKSAYANSHGVSGTGHVCALYSTGITIINSSTLSFDIYISATHAATSSITTYALLPATLDWTKF